MLLVVRTLTSRKVCAHPVSAINSAPTNRDAAAFIQNMAESCPQTKLVLGYSQGAAVVDILTATGRSILGFTSPLPETVADQIAVVAVFGNWRRHTCAESLRGGWDDRSGSVIRRC